MSHKKFLSPTTQKKQPIATSKQYPKIDLNHSRSSLKFVMIQDHGFRPDEILDDHYVLGGLGDDVIPDEIINPNRDHTPFLPQFKDIQNLHGLETMNCTVYGAQNGIEILEKEQYNIDRDYDERTVGIGADTTKGGNSPHTVCEWIRHNGLTSGRLPFSPDINTWHEYYSPKPLPQNILDEALKWLDEYEFKHQWIFKGGSLEYKQNLLWAMLQRCAPGVSVKAWKFRNGLYYKDRGESDNHWVTLVSAKWKQYWLILDHYDQLLKKLEWNYDFMFAKRYYLKKKSMNPQIPKLLKKWSGKLLMDSTVTGDIGLVQKDKVLIAKKDHPERLAHILALYLIEKGEGTGIDNSLWSQIPKQEV